MKRMFNWMARGGGRYVLCGAVIAIIGLSSCRTVEKSSFDSAGTQIFYTVQGSGEPLILLHGWSATGWANWRIPRTAALLDDEFMVIIPEIKGSGAFISPSPGYSQYSSRASPTGLVRGTRSFLWWWGEKRGRHVFARGSLPFLASLRLRQ